MEKLKKQLNSELIRFWSPLALFAIILANLHFFVGCFVELAFIARNFWVS